MNVGILGTGNMGKIIIEALIESGAISPSNLNITNRTLNKAREVQLQYEKVNLLDANKDVIQNSDIIFICVKPHDIYGILQENRALFSRDKCLVSITSPISVGQLQTVVDCSCARAIPSITNRALSGVSLLTFGESCSEKWRQTISDLLNKISRPVEIEENVTRVSSDIVSCGPAFFSYLTQRFINAAVKETEIDNETATILASEMLIGLGDLLKKEIYTLPTLQEKVCVKGGITGVGISVMEKELGNVFEELIKATHDKYKKDREETQSQFGL
jgi:competence protein ComER